MYRRCWFVLVAAAIWWMPARTEAAGPSAQAALQLKPVQADVDYDVPTGDEVEACKIEAKKLGKAVGWEVSNGQGVTLRRFLDTNGDNKVDMWCYFAGGIEVYRDIDSDGNGKVDQYRWLNTAGTRWGIDTNEDGKIDKWQAISPEEVAYEAVKALADSDEQRFLRLLLSADELKQLPLSEEHATKVAEHLAKARSAFRAAATAAGLSDVDWVQFNANRPGVIPGDTASADVYVYENALAFTERKGEPLQLLLGTLVRVGNAWRLVDAPSPVSAETASAEGIFFTPPAVASATPQVPEAASTAQNAPNAELQKLIEAIADMDQAIASASSLEQQAELYEKRTQILEQLIAKSETEQDRAMWIRQLADETSAAVQSGAFPKGIDHLKALYEALKKDPKRKELAALVRLRQITAEYGLAIQDPKADYAKVQETWMSNLEGFVKDYGDVPAAAEAMLQLGISLEYAGETEKAQQWYQQLVDRFPNSPDAAKAKGAIRRLNLVGQRLELQGHDPQGGLVDLSAYRGKVVLIQFWASWCEPCKQDMPLLKDLISRYGSKLAVIGINLDNSADQLKSFLAENRLPWPQIFEEGGLDSKPATDLGVFTLPTVILVDPEGRVVSCNLSTAGIDEQIKSIVR